VYGIYAAGSSHASPTWRIIVDTDRHTIWAGTSKASVPSFGPLEHEATKELSPRNRVFLTQIAEDAWREPPAEPPDPRAETGETFVVLDDEDALYLQDAGPIRRPAAARAIIELRAAAGL